MTQSNIRYLAIHYTHTQPGNLISSELPFHYIITRGGTPRCLRNVSPLAGCLDIALEGGVDHTGIPCDDRTKEQNDRLHSILTRFTALHPDAKLVDAAVIYGPEAGTIGFDLTDWYEQYQYFKQAA